MQRWVGRLGGRTDGGLVFRFSSYCIYAYVRGFCWHFLFFFCSVVVIVVLDVVLVVVIVVVVFVIVVVIVVVAI